MGTDLLAYGRASRYLAVLCVAIAGCATPVSFIIPQGSSICTGTSLAKCEELHRLAMSLNTPEMDKLVRQAQCEAQQELCK